jgi:hypothetical protein
MAGPGDELAASAGGHGHLRTSRADREHVVDVLKAAFVQGRLTQDELDERASQVFASRTYAELAAVTADLPAGLAIAQSSSMPAGVQAEQPVAVHIKRDVIKRDVNACVATVLGAVLLIAVAIYIDQRWLALISFGGITAAAFLAGFAAAAQKLSSRRDKSHGGQLPPQSASATQAEQAPQSSQAPPHEAEAVQSRRPRRWRYTSATSANDLAATPQTSGA